MDKLDKLLRTWAEKHRPGDDKLEALTRDVCRSAASIKPGAGGHRKPPRPSLRVKLGYAFSGALASAAVFLAFINIRPPADTGIITPGEPAIYQPPALRGLAEPARRRLETMPVTDMEEPGSLQTAVRGIFPRIEAETGWLFSLGVIAGHLAGYGCEPVGEDAARLVRQPFGVVARGYEVNLQTSEVTVYPGTHEKGEPWVFVLPDESGEKFLAMVKSGKFLNLPHRGGRVGRDGAWYFIEADISGRYHWVLRWRPEEQIVLDIFSIIEKEADIGKQQF